MKNTKILSALLLSALICTTILTSCGGDTTTAADTTAADAATTEASEAEPEVTEVPLEIPEDADYEGYDFKILTYDVGLSEGGYSQMRNYQNIVAEEENGDPINDAVYKRNRMVEEKLNITISPMIAVDKQMTNTIIKDIQAGETEYDSAFQMVRAALNTAAQGYLIDLYTVDTLHLDKPWWDQRIQEGLSIGNKMFVITGDATLEDKEGLLILFYNEKVGEDLGMEDIFTTYNDGRWTMDEMYKRCTAATRDLDGDGAINHNDAVGTGMNYTSLNAFLGAIGSGYAHLEDGVPVSSLEDERTVTFMQWVAEFMNDGNAMLQSTTTEGGWTTFTNMFKDDRMLIRTGGYYNAPPFRDMESEFSMISYPKYDEAQEEYQSTTSPHASTGFIIPVTCSDYERVGVIMEVMSNYSTDTVLDAYITTTLEGKIARNEESYAMMESIINTALYDIGYAYNWMDINKVTYESIKTSDSNFVSAYAAVRDAYNAAMNETYELYK